MRTHGFGATAALAAFAPISDVMQLAKLVQGDFRNRLWQKHFEAEIAPVSPLIPPDILVGQYRGKWENTPERTHEGER